MGVGAAMTGLRPIVEGMNMGFLLLAFSQISNNAGMLHYTSGGNFKVPMVIRGPGGAFEGSVRSTVQQRLTTVSQVWVASWAPSTRSAWNRTSRPFPACS
jgi:pyruvate dehydrogenase E1 component beta subunit